MRDVAVAQGADCLYTVACRWNLSEASDTVCLLQRFLLLQFLLRWLTLGVWIFFAVLAYQVSFYVQREEQNLHLATALSAGFLGVVCLALTRLLYSVWRTFRDKQSWYEVKLPTVHLVCVHSTACINVITSAFC